MGDLLDLLNADGTEIEEQRVLRDPGATTGDVLTVNADKTISAASVGSSQTYVTATLQSSDGPNQGGSVPVLTPQGNIPLTMPLSAYGAGGNIRVTLTNNSGADVKAGGSLVGLDAAGNLMERDTSGDQVVADGAADRIDFDSDGGGAVVGLAWNGTDKQIDVTGNGPFAATAAIYVKPA